MLFEMGFGCLGKPANGHRCRRIEPPVVHIQQVTQPKQHGHKARVRVVGPEAVRLKRQLQNAFFVRRVALADDGQQIDQPALDQAAVSEVDFQSLGNAVDVAPGHRSVLPAEIGRIDEPHAAGRFEGPYDVLLLVLFHLPEPLDGLAQVPVLALGQRGQIVLKFRIVPRFFDLVPLYDHAQIVGIGRMKDQPCIRRREVLHPLAQQHFDLGNDRVGMARIVQAVVRIVQQNGLENFRAVLAVQVPSGVEVLIFLVAVAVCFQMPVQTIIAHGSSLRRARVPGGVIFCPDYIRFSSILQGSLRILFQRKTKRLLRTTSPSMLRIATSPIRRGLGIAESFLSSPEALLLGELSSECETERLLYTAAFSAHCFFSCGA